MSDVFTIRAHKAQTELYRPNVIEKLTVQEVGDPSARHRKSASTQPSKAGFLGLGLAYFGCIPLGVKRCYKRRGEPRIRKGLVLMSFSAI